MEERQRTVSGRELPENSETTGMTGIFIIFSGERTLYRFSEHFPGAPFCWWFQAGFQETYNEGHTGMESGEKVLPYALDWLDRNGTKKDWYLHVHFWDPHTPYRAPASFGNPFEKERLRRGSRRRSLKNTSARRGRTGCRSLTCTTMRRIPAIRARRARWSGTKSSAAS